MGFHHVSLATKDLVETHRFYTEVMGFELVKVQCSPTPSDTGWSRLAFYDTGGGGLMSFFDLHDDAIASEYRTDLSESVGLPGWVNHVAFDAATRRDFEARKQRWREHGITVIEMDWGTTISIYATDPNGILVEFTWNRTHFASKEDRARALERLRATEPNLDPVPTPQVFDPIEIPRPLDPAPTLSERHGIAH
jgi:catechol 2,3-dioxygenase-like lactoylglutathione lyase family enzyme